MNPPLWYFALMSCLHISSLGPSRWLAYSVRARTKGGSRDYSLLQRCQRHAVRDTGPEILRLQNLASSKKPHSRACQELRIYEG
ncbi:unnamed protein product, partial [Ectocarpus sp. 8 AP-2014]